MNKTIIININSIVFHIEEDAYETLRTYMIDIKKHFGNTVESKEILEDIENRIAEMFSERIQLGRKEVINQSDVREVILQMGQVSDFDEHQDDNASYEQPKATQDTFTDSFGKKLMRDPDDKVLGGVCSGLGYYFRIEPRWVRVLFVLFLLIGGSGFLLYFILWIVMPEAETRADKMAMRGEEPNLQNFKKSFDEDVRNFSDNFSEAGAQFTHGARRAGNAVGGCFGFLLKLVAWVLLITSGLSLLGMFIFYAFNLMNLSGLENPIFFPPLELLVIEDAFVAITFGFLAICIPIFAFSLLLIKLLFRTEKLNNYLSLSMFAVWVVSIFGIIYFCVSTSQDFKENSTISLQRNIKKGQVYNFTMKDVRILDANDKDSLMSKFNMNINGEDLRNYLRNDINISFESLDSLSQPYIQYNYSAKGKTYQLAAARAKSIVYEAIQDGNTLLFPSHFLLPKNALNRDQRVRLVVYLPVGASVVLHEEIEWKLRGVSYSDCRTNYGDEEQVKLTEWKMTKTGLMCTKQAKKEAKSDEDDEPNDADNE